MQWVRVHAVLWWGLCAVFVDFFPFHSLTHSGGLVFVAHLYAWSRWISSDTYRAKLPIRKLPLQPADPFTLFC
jgi:hypothetical protein